MDIKARKTFGKLNIKDLTTDRDYQRALKPAFIKKCVRDFEPLLIQSIHVSVREDGTLAIIDGQHTCEILKKVYGNDYLTDCVIYHGLTIEQEAYMFNKLNTEKRKVSFGEIMRSKLAQGDLDVASYISCFELANVKYEFDFTRCGSNSRKYVAHSAGWKAYKRFGAKAFVSALKCVNEIDDVQMLNGRIITGLTCCFSVCDYLNSERMKSAMIKTGFDEIFHIASAYGKITEGNAFAFGRALADIYNKGLRSKKIIISE